MATTTQQQSGSGKSSTGNSGAGSSSSGSNYTGAQRIADSVSLGATDMKDALVETGSAVLEEVQKSAHLVYEDALDAGKRRAELIEERIIEAPFAAVGMAFLGGMVMAAWLRR